MALEYRQMPKFSAPVIAVTRSGDAAGELGQHLRALGTEVTEIPLLRFVPRLTRTEWLSHVSELGPGDWLLLTSPQAVRALLPLVEAGDLRHLQVAAVGAGTARPWQAAGGPLHYLPPEATAEDLAAGLPAQAGARALHPTSPLSEDTLRLGLAARGVSYERCVLYSTEAAAVTAQGRAALAQAAAIALASGSAARALAALAGPDFDPLTRPIAVMGEQTARAARSVGFTHILQARTPSLAALAEAAAWGSQRLSSSGTPFSANKTSSP